MANEVSVSIAKGVDGFKNTDFTVSTNAPGAGDIEVRISDSTAIKRKDVIIGLQAIIRELEQGIPISKIKAPVL
jgi:hypothetical protein